MLFYQRIVALSDQTHAHLRMKPQTTFRYAAKINSVPILAGEIAECARYYPIVFGEGENGLVPVALLGLREGENLFVGVDGRWAVPYVPAFVRRYPFIGAKGPDGRVVVCIDETASCLGATEGDPLFAEGAPTAALNHALQFLNEFQAGAAHTEALAARLGSLNLLREADSMAQLKTGQKFRLGGLRVVDENCLRELADADVLDLFRSGGLQMIHLHLLSLGNLGPLLDRLAEREATTKSRAGATRH